MQLEAEFVQTQNESRTPVL